MSGGGLIASVALVQLGVPIGMLGLLILGLGIFGHIQSPLTFSDLMDSVIGLTGAAICAAFGGQECILAPGSGDRQARWAK